MNKVSVYNLTGKVVGEQALNEKIFAVAVKPEVVHQAVVAQMANSRVAIAHTKTKSEIRGGGRKPWKQKGTGRARQGSIRSPQWRGGGVVFGPRSNRNFELKLNKNMKQKALAMVLSDKVTADHFIVVDNFNLADIKTQALKKSLAALPSGQSKTLLVLGDNNQSIIRSARNLAKIGYLAANSLNVVDLLKYDYVIVDQAGIQQIEAIYQSKKKGTTKK